VLILPQAMSWFDIAVRRYGRTGQRLRVFRWPFCLLRGRLAGEQDTSSAFQRLTFVDFYAFQISTISQNHAMSGTTPKTVIGSAVLSSPATNSALVRLKFGANVVEMHFTYLPRVGEMIVFENDGSKYTVSSVAHHVQRLSAGGGSCEVVEVFLRSEP
jgi:hypothetical protein